MKQILLHLEEVRLLHLIKAYFLSIQRELTLVNQNKYGRKEKLTGIPDGTQPSITLMREPRKKST